MATHIVSLTIFILFLISANGRSLQKEIIRGRNVNLSHFYSTVNGKLVKSVSRATSTYKTNYTDVSGLAILTTQYPLLVEGFENDDPCVPPIWDWIECNSDPAPRVIALDLSSSLLYPQVPDFSIMDALQRIDLSQCDLVGIIPSFLGTFPDLQELNLANNLYYGEVPDSLACNKNLKLTLTGNAGLTMSGKCSTSNNLPSSPANENSGGDSGGISVEVPSTSRKTNKKSKSNLGGILGGTISAFVVFWAAVGGYAMHRHKTKAAAAIAEAASTNQGPTAYTPMEELPMNVRPNHQMSPSS